MSPFSKELASVNYTAYLCSPEELEASQARCRDLKVPFELDKPREILPKIALASRLAENSLLLTLAEQVITSEQYTGLQNNHIYILCDRELIALKIFAAPEVLAAAEKTGIKPGTVFTEESCGANALALAREHNRLKALRGEQHYCRLFKDWWCVAGPVKDPMDNTLGYLDISMNAKKELGLAVALLKTLIGLVEKEFLLLELQQKLKQIEVKLPPSPALPSEVERELTLREQEVAELLVSRLTNEEITQRLHITPGTLKTHRKNIFQKLGVHSLNELLSRYCRK